VMSNSQAFANRLMDLGYTLVSGGTSNHLCLVDLKPQGVDGSRVERVLELAHIAANKNTVPGDKSALVPGGLRMGTPALTSRGFTEEDFVEVANLVHKAVEITKGLKGKTKTLKEFRESLLGEVPSEIVQLKKEVEALATRFPTIGFDGAEMRYQE